MTDLRSQDYDPYAVLLELQHRVEQLEYHQNYMAQLLQNQARVIERLSQTLLVIVNENDFPKSKIEDSDEK